MTYYLLIVSAPIVRAFLLTLACPQPLFLSFLDVSGPLLVLLGVLYEAPFSLYILNQKRRRVQDHQGHQNTQFERIPARLPVLFGRLGPFIGALWGPLRGAFFNSHHVPKKAPITRPPKTPKHAIWMHLKRLGLHYWPRSPSSESFGMCSVWVFVFTVQSSTLCIRMQSSCAIPTVPSCSLIVSTLSDILFISIYH